MVGAVCSRGCRCEDGILKEVTDGIEQMRGVFARREQSGVPPAIDEDEQMTGLRILVDDHAHQRGQRVERTGPASPWS